MTGKRRAEPPHWRRHKAGGDPGGDPGADTGGDAAGEPPPEAEQPRIEQPRIEQPPTSEPAPGIEPGAPPAGAATPVIAPIKTRRQQRLERRARRRRLGWWGIAGIVVVVAVIAAAVGFGVHTITEKPPPAGDAQVTLLLQVAGQDGKSVGGILIGHEVGTRNGVELLVPASLFTSVCGFGQESFGDILALPGGAAQAASALSSQLDDMHIDGTWTLTESQLAGLVSAVGGVTTDVDVDVTRPGPHGTTIVEIQHGTQHLDGAQAVQFATYHDGAREDASGQLARLQAVVQAAVDKLPRSPAAVQTIVGRLGTGAASSLGVSRLASLLVALAADDRHDGGVLASDLPTIKLDTGGAPSYNIDESAAQRFVLANFADSVPRHRSGGFAVLVENGYGTPGLVPSACKRLSAAGLDVTGGGNVGTGQATSQILINDRTVADTERGQEVARLLHLPPSEVQGNPVPSSNEDVVVVLGKDYRP